jgi:hypothetical protein
MITKISPLLHHMQSYSSFATKRMFIKEKVRRVKKLAVDDLLTTN